MFSVLLASGLTTEDQQGIDNMLYYVSVGVAALICGLLLLTLGIRQIARRTTQPCRWCMEFISNKARVCPKCGKALPDEKGP
jgi:hypothetical protein